jgi:group I intron endonuclease
MIAGIYEIRNLITGDCYIGSSVNLLQRKNRHFKDLKNNKHHSIILQRAYNKYNKEFFKFNVIEVIKDQNLLIEREQYFLDKINPKYNISPTAGSPLGCKQTKESCEKKRKYAIDNNIIPPESTWIARQEKVLMLDYNTLTIIKEFNSLSEACRFIGKDSTFASTISACCKNKRYSAYGYRWVFNKEDIKTLRTKKKLISWNKGKKVGNKLSKKVKQFDLNMNFIKEWNSVKEAECFFGKGISNCATGKSKTSNGYIWRY